MTRNIFLLGFFAIVLSGCWKPGESPNSKNDLFEKHILSPIPPSVSVLAAKELKSIDMKFVCFLELDQKDFDKLLKSQNFQINWNRYDDRFLSPLHAISKFTEIYGDFNFDLSAAEYYQSVDKIDSPYTYYVIAHYQHNRTYVVKVGF